MTRKEIESHQHLVNNGKAKEFYKVSYYIYVKNNNTKIKVYCYFRSNIPISLAEHVLRGQEIKREIGEYKEKSLKLISYEKMPNKIGFFISENEYNEWKSNKDTKCSKKQLTFD